MTSLKTYLVIDRLMIMLRSSTRSEILLRRRGYVGRTNHGCARIPNPENRRGARPNQNAKDISARTAKKPARAGKQNHYINLKQGDFWLVAYARSPSKVILDFFLFKII